MSESIIFLKKGVLINAIKLWSGRAMDDFLAAINE